LKRPAAVPAWLEFVGAPFSLALLLCGVFSGTGAGADTWRPIHAVSPIPPSPPDPFARVGHTAIYEPQYRRMLVYGGIVNLSVWDEVLSLNLDHPDAWVVIAPGQGPTAAPQRRDHVAVYDAPRNRMIVFGGCFSTSNSTARNEVFAFDLGAAPQWNRIFPDNSGGFSSLPSPRFALCAIYDPVRERLVIFGGATENGVFLNDVWALPLNGAPRRLWEHLAPQGTGPSARDLMSAIYDPVRDRMIVFGGWDHTHYLNDTWALSLSGGGTWEELSTAGTPPSPRRNTAIAYDSGEDRVIVAGGFNGEYLDDLYALSLGGGMPTWSALPHEAGSGPTGRVGPRAVYDPVKPSLVLFGGYGGPAGNEAYLNDTWSYALAPDSGWSRLAKDSVLVITHPGARREHVAVVDTPGDRMIVFGGINGIQTLLNDTWTLSLAEDATWIPVGAQGAPPSKRFSLAGAMDTSRHRLLVFGGFDGAFLNQLWALQLDGTPTWSNLTPDSSTPAPLARDAMSAVYDSLGDRLVVFGGWSGSEFLADLWAFGFSGDSLGWHELQAGAGPAARRHYALAYDTATRQMILSGGETGEFVQGQWNIHNLADTWALDLDPAHTPAWSLLNNDTAGAPMARNGQRAVMTKGQRFIEFGGSGDASRNDTWAFGPLGVSAWNELSADGGYGIPTSRTKYTLAYDGARSRAILYGGEGHAGEVTGFSDVWELLFDSESGGGPLVDASPGGTVALAIRRIAPNPAHGPIDVWFTLPRAGGATLELYNVAGRRVLGRDIGTMPAGEHRVNLAAEGAVAPGVYFVALSQNGVVRRTKVAILN
jgi:hypothetical protein